MLMLPDRPNANLSITIDLEVTVNYGLVAGELAEPVLVLFAASVFLHITLMFMLLRKRFTKLITKTINMTEKTPEIVIQTNLYLNKLTWAAYWVVFTSTLVIGVINYVFGLHCEGRNLSGDKRYVCGLHHYIWYPFETEYGSLRHTAVVLYAGLSQTLAAAYYDACFFCCVAVPWVLKARLQDLREQIERADAETFEEKFHDFILYYAKIFQCIKEMNESIGQIFFYEYLVMIPLTAILEYVNILGYYENIIFLVVVFMIQYSFCHVGQHLEDEHERLLRAVYFLPWYDMNIEMRKKYRLFMGNFEVPIHFKGYPLLNINNETQLSMLKGSYSVATFLMNSSE